jgi:excisionase family DNA binding protein
MADEMQKHEGKYHDIDWAAEYTDLSVPTIRLRVQKKTFPHIRVGRRVLFTRELIDNFLRAHAVPAEMAE